MRKIYYLLHPKKTSFTIFLLTIAGIYLADSIMTYIFPVAVEEALGSNLRMGIIMGLSSVAGLICDFFLPSILRSKTWKFYFIGGVLISLLFPILTSLGYLYSSFEIFVVASVIWGIYFEFLLFTMKEYIFAEEDKSNYSKDWGILYTLMQFLEIIAPIIGAFLLITFISSSVLLVIPIQILSLVIFLVTSSKQKKKIIETEHISINFHKEIRVWYVIVKDIYPVLIGGVILMSYDAIFWTIGALLGEQIFGSLELSWIVITAYSIATLLGAVILFRFKIVTGKKLFINIAIFLSALITILLLLDISNPIIITAIIFFAGLMMSFARPLNEAVISDYLLRLGKSRHYLLGIANGAGSLAFIIFPVIAGFLSDKFNYKTAIGIYGIIILVISIFLLIVTPRKIKLHQKEINGD